MKLRTHVAGGRATVVAPGPVRARPRGRAWEIVRQRVAARDGWRCCRCGEAIDSRLQRPHPRALQVHHLVEIAAGGSDAEENLTAMHADCHRALGGRVVAPAGRPSR